jgi:RND family efflux transporter MFP subunit
MKKILRHWSTPLANLFSKIQSFLKKIYESENISIVSNKNEDQVKLDKEGSASSSTTLPTAPVTANLLPDDVKKWEIIFPLEPEEKMLEERRSSFAMLVILFVCMGGAFSYGYLSSPENIAETRNTLMQIWMDTGELAQPYIRQIKDEVETLKKSKILPRKSADMEGMVSSPPKGSSDKKIKYWKAPMTPGFRSDKPGKSPMGMDLIPVYEDEPSASSTSIVKTSRGFRQSSGIQTAIVQTRKLSRTVRAAGALTYDERMLMHIHTKYEGWIEKLYVDFTGQEVAKNEVLAEVYSPSLVATQEELLLALKYNQTLKSSSIPEIIRGTQGLLDSAKKKLELLDVRDHQIEALLRDKKIMKTMHIHSPGRGFVVKRNVNHGSFIKPGMNLYTLADLTNIWVLADIYEYELPWIRLGQTVSMTLSYFPGRSFEGKVTFINPVVDPKTRTIQVRMEFDNPDWELKPDMYANVMIQSPIEIEALAVPEEAVIRSGLDNRVVVQNAKGQFSSEKVTLGAQAEGYIQVVEGLEAGDKIVTSSNFLIDSESNLKEALGKIEDTSK